MEIIATYGIGDIHGQHGRLLKLLHRCKDDCFRRGFDGQRLVFIGDYVDRGPDSRKVLELLMKLQEDSGERIVALKGNHEQILVAAAQDNLSNYGVTLDEWLTRGGGAATLESYGVEHPSDLPQAHIDWLDSLPLCHDDGARFFCHAGVHPEFGCEGSRENDLLLIREPFLSSTIDFGRLVVHGHTPVADGHPEIRSNRVNLDTGAGYGGPITAAVFGPKERNPIHFISE